MIEPADVLREGDALLVVDVQVDFCPGGALPIGDGDAVVPVLNRWIGAAGRAGVPMYFSRDWHPRVHPSFAAEGGEWPAHCVQDTGGAKFHPDLWVPAEAVIVSKGTRLDRDQYSVFDGTGLAVRMRKDGVRRLFVGGLALDVCVRAAVLDGLKQGFAVHVIKDACRPVSEEGGRRALNEMLAVGALVEEE